jgi:allantoinase
VRAEDDGQGSIVIRDGKIAAITREAYRGPAREVIQAHHLAALPGVIDTHTHMRDPGMTAAEDWTTGTRAAAGGGVTTILEHPNTIPPASTVEGLRRKREIASAKSIVDFALIGGAGEGNLHEIAGLAAEGAVAFKTFMQPAGGPHMAGCATLDDGVLLELFSAVAQTGRPHNVHAEDQPLIEHFTRAARRQGRLGPEAHDDIRPVLSEVAAFSRAMLLAEASGVRLNFVHASSGSAVDRVLQFRQAGLKNVTIETCPHYLVLTRQRMAEVGPYAKFNPPLRSEEERARLWAHLAAGAIDTIGSDHAPHPFENVERGWDDITAAPGGSPGLATLLPVMLTQAHAGRLDLQALVRLTSANAARLYGLFPRKGALEAGSDADVVLVDLEARRAIEARELHSKDPRVSRMWAGFQSVGVPVMTIVRGTVVMRDGEVLGQPGHGEFIAP